MDGRAWWVEGDIREKEVIPGRLCDGSRCGKCIGTILIAPGQLTLRDRYGRIGLHKPHGSYLVGRDIKLGDLVERQHDDVARAEPPRPAKERAGLDAQLQPFWQRLRLGVWW